MNRVLFVDDDPNVLQGLRRMLREMRHEWHMEFAGGGEEALALLAAAPFQLIVSDMRMPRMDGSQLLTEVMRRHPEVVRIVLSGQAEDEAVIRTVGAAHQYLSKPCDPEVLKKTLQRACALRSLLGDDALKSFVSQLRSLPSLPSLYTSLLDECRAPQGSLQTVGEIIAKDVAMTAKILHLVNSSFFGVRGRVSSPVQAVQLLGLDAVKSLALSAGVFSQFEQGRLGGFSIDALWRHSVRAGAFSRIVAAAETKDSHVVADASVAGLLHDAGQLVLAANLPDRLAQARALATAEGISLCEAELKTLGATHATIGAYLLGLWGLPDAIVEAVAYHHEPRLGHGERFTPLTAVHVGDALANTLGDAASCSPSTAPDEAYLTALGLMNRMPAWREACTRHEEATRNE